MFLVVVLRAQSDFEPFFSIGESMRKNGNKGFGSLTLNQLGGKHTKQPDFVGKFDEILTKTTQHTREVVVPADPTVYRLFPSSFPYCGLKAWYDEEPLASDSEEDFLGSLIMGYGTTLHEVLQYYLGQTAKLYGRWACSCGYISRGIKLAPDKCPKCKSTEPLTYTELRVAVQDQAGVDILSGRIDLIIEMEEKLYLVDFKSSNPNTITSHRTFGTVFPYRKDMYQITSYIPLLEQKMKREVDGWILAYIDRHDPSNRVLVGEEVTEGLRQEWSERVAEWVIQGLLVKQFYVLQDQLSRQQKEGIVQQLVGRKFCKCRKDYEEKFKSRYTECTLGEERICFKPKALSKHLQGCLIEMEKREPDEN